ncbi:MAG: heparinase, partial [Alphaproteobacteria bacterium]|nr:heparinase [Alphaproteobacteria bacterium]
MIGRLRLALRLPLSVTIRHGVGIFTGYWRARSERAADSAVSTYAANAPIGPLNPLLDGLDAASYRPLAAFAVPLADLHTKGLFDLLGSGWVAVRHGMSCAGVEGHAYPPAPAVTPDRAGAWLQGRINPANLAAAQAAWRLTGNHYTPIDWHLDFKSGFRWREDSWHGDIAYGRAPGADIKVPWELARMQHLSLFAAAYAATGNELYARAARDQILDFIAQNPPRFGVNWRCAMDVSIRAANWVVAWSLFKALGYSFDAAFEETLKQSLCDHGRYVVRHLEWYPEGRGNHYLADVAGLAFIATTLPPAPETDAWLAFAAQEIPAEIEHQFYPDGGNFEASVPYHRLSLEMAVFALALIAGLPEARRRQLGHADPGVFPARTPHPLRLPLAPPNGKTFARVARAAEFLRDLTKPGGAMAQIGDNDSGRFFKLHPVYEKTTVAEARARYANLDDWRGLSDDAA